MPPIEPPLTVAFSNAAAPVVVCSTASASAICLVTIRNNLESAPLETVASSVRRSCLKPLACVPLADKRSDAGKFDLEKMYWLLW